MFSLPDKSKQFLTTAVKLFIIGLAFYFIWSRLSGGQWQFFTDTLQNNFSWPIIGALVVLGFLNRFFEIIKWQNLVSCFQTISLPESTQQVLGALTASVFTPNGIGEYGAKAMYYEAKRTRKIVFLNLVCNGAQMLITVVLGVVGLLYFNLRFGIISTRVVFTIIVGFGIAAVLAYVLRSFTVKGFSFEKAIKKIHELPKAIHRKNIFLAFCRYAFFSHQYYLILLMFDTGLSYPIAMATICSVYFLSSSLPTFQFLDFAVKGGVAVYFFGLLGINQWIPLFATTLIWLLNVVIPVAIGSYYVLTFKRVWKH
jgi:uncharacterized membrane protein YbhN (UPF0104 family)